MIPSSGMFSGNLNTSVSESVCSASNNNVESCNEDDTLKDWPALGAVFFGIFLAGWGGVSNDNTNLHFLISVTLTLLTGPSR